MKQKEFDALRAFLRKEIGRNDEMNWNHDIASSDIGAHRTARNALWDMLRAIEDGKIPGVECETWEKPVTVEDLIEYLKTMDGSKRVVVGGREKWMPVKIYRQWRDRCQIGIGNDGLFDEANEVTEVCPNCEQEITMAWDVNKDGYQAFCPHCGKRLMLCDECTHREKGGCDYSMKTDRCRFQEKKK